MAQKPGIPKGTRDFGPAELARRYYIIEVIREAFECFGFQPIETPSFENYDTLMGKYGEEGDRLIFKILNSGDFLSKVGDNELTKGDANSLTPKISEKALRYDLTVPFARYVVMHQNELDFPFKRYQIQPVWRADRPQRGRFREFYQCDADVVGATGVLQELEFVQLYDRVFDKLGLKGVTIKINHRKVLVGMAEVIGASDKLIDFTVALEKLDKVGAGAVEKEMLDKGISAEAVTRVRPLLDTSMDAMGRFEKLEELLANSRIGQEGLADLRTILEQTAALGVKASALVVDVTLARGLNYYTGAIFEVAAPEGVEMGSIGGGGRYDDLTGIFGLKDLSGVGISFGLDRIYLVMEQLGLFPPGVDQQLDVFCINFGEAEAQAAFKLVLNLRSKGIRADIYPNTAKVGKQFKYADKRGVPRVILIGDEELKAGNFTVREMKSGEQTSYSLDQWEAFARRISRNTLP